MDGDPPLKWSEFNQKGTPIENFPFILSRLPNRGSMSASFNLRSSTMVLGLDNFPITDLIYFLARIIEFYLSSIST